MANQQNFQKRGFPLPLGVSIQEEGVNFALFARHASTVVLVVRLDKGGDGGLVEVPLDQSLHKTGDIWHVSLDLKTTEFTYGYKIDGESIEGRVYDSDKILIDPFCHKLLPRQWGVESSYGEKPACKIIQHDFDWKGDKPLKTPLSETIIYELHVRGFTNSDTSEIQCRGSYKGIIEKIEHLKKLGITAVELMPVMEFDENDNIFRDPENSEILKNFWGYNSVSFFALKSGYANDPADHINEFKCMVRSLHEAGIEVILDMVYNHSGEGGYDGTTSSFRGIDNSIYYLLGPEQYDYLNFSGCGNTMNCNHPVMRELIRESLRFWVIEMHVDGFRFDLASILGRDQDGTVLPNPPMIEIIAEDPVLRDTKIIAEAWDAAGLYQVGSFSRDSRWAEWNGRFRDDVRMFFAGYDRTVTNIATRIAGSSDLYQTSSRSPLSSINFLTSHDGFTLNDLVTYEKKYNLRNGEDNRDGDNHNLSWNSGEEGESETLEVFRKRRMKSMAAVLLLSQGVPMITAGDEFGRTQNGNNNAWCQDNALGWIDWSFAQKNDELLRFFKGCIRLRRSHSVFRRDSFFVHDVGGSSEKGEAGITWQGLKVGEQDWSDGCHHLAFLLHADGLSDANFFVMMNGDKDDTVYFEIPTLSGNGEKQLWRKIIDTSEDGGKDVVSIEDAKVVANEVKIKVQAQTVIVLQSSLNNLPST